MDLTKELSEVLAQDLVLLIELSADDGKVPLQKGAAIFIRFGEEFLLQGLQLLMIALMCLMDLQASLSQMKP